jgi:excisionase family DNA binding protein
MTLDQANKIRQLIRQGRETLKTCIDDLSAIAEKGLEVFAEVESGAVESIAQTGHDVLLTKRELAARLKVSLQTVNKWQTEGMPFIKRGKPIRFDYQDVREWLKASDKETSGKTQLRVVK